jgi:hypothetical protein
MAGIAHFNMRRSRSPGARDAAGYGTPPKSFFDGNPLLTRVKRESLGKYEAEPRRFIRLFTLHDASLEGHVGAAGLRVNQRG